MTTPGHNRKTKKLDCDTGVVKRRKIQEFYNVRNKIPTVKKLKGNRKIMRQHIKKIGFRYRKTKTNRKVIMEKNDK